MGRIGFPLKSSACILIFLVLQGFYCISKETWCYDKPSCEPGTWVSLGFCNGKRQSPININTKEVLRAELGPIRFTNYENPKLAKNLENKGYYVEVGFHPGATISSSSISEPYFLKAFHFHWGTDDSNGSEHTIDGKRCSLELHLVHTKNNMTIEEAKKDSEGVVVLAFLIQKSQGIAQVTPWNTLANLFKEIPEKGDSRVLNGEFSMGGLLSTADVSHYYSYKGSFTIPDCQEVITWIIFEEPIMVSDEVIKVFTNTVYFTTIKENRPMQNNFRPVQPLNNRKIYYYEESTSLTNCLQRCFSKQRFYKDFKSS